MKTKIQFVTFILIVILTFAYTNGCFHKKEVTQCSERRCDTIKTNVKQNLNSVVFLNKAVGIATGNSGTIIRTKNGGYVWEKINSINQKHIYGLAVADSFTIIAVGEGGTILRSEDKGINWIDVSYGTRGALRSVMFYDSKIGFAAGDSGLALYTKNGGRNWSKVPIRFRKTIYSISHSIPDSTTFFVGDEGQILRYKKILSSHAQTDLPENLRPETTRPWWTNELNRSDSEIKDRSLRSLKSICFAPGSINTGFIVGDKGTILKTTDGGKIWNEVSSVTSENLKQVVLKSAHSGYAVGDKGTVLIYNGINWKPLEKNYTSMRINAAASIYHTTVLVGEDGMMLLLYPPYVSNLTTATTSSDDYVTWQFELSGFNPDDTIDGALVQYKHFEICTDAGVDLGKGQPVGWAVLDNFFGRSDSLIVGGQMQWPLYLLERDSGILTCYLIDQNGDPYTLCSSVYNKNK